MAAKLDNVWGIETRDEGKADRETRITDFWGFFALAFPSLAVPGLGVPAGELAGLALGMLAIIRLPAQDARPPFGFTAGISGILLWLTGVGLAAGVLDERRLAHVAILVLAAGLASGRISSTLRHAA